MKKESCIVCSILEGSIPSYIVFEDDVCAAILDVNGSHLGHTLIIPKEHYPIIEQVPDEVVGHLFSIANKVSSILFEKLRTIQGTNIFVANGVPAGQRVAHVMVHVIPRMEKDSVNLQWQPKQFSDEEMATAELKLKDQLQDVGVVAKSENPVAFRKEKEPSLVPDDDEDNHFSHHFNRVPRG